MGLYKYDNGVLIPIAGRGKAEYGASTTRNNTWTNTETIAPGGSVPFSVAFDVPMPDANYEVNWTCSASALHPVIDEKTASGFTGHAYRLVSPAVDSGNGVINFTAFRLYTDLEYNELLDDTEGLIKNTTESGVVNQFETTIHSQRYNKVVYTVNDDGTIALEIIQRPDTNTGLSIGFIDVKAGETYKLTGGLSANERLELKNMDYSAWTNNTVNKAVSSPIVDTNIDTFMPNADATLRVYLRIDASGNTGNVGTIEPMIRFASFLDDTFIPYAKTNRLLTVETDELFANAAMLKGMTEIDTQTDLNDVTAIGNYFKSSTSIYVTNAPTGIDSETSAIFRLNVENGSDSTDKYIQTIIKNDGTTYKRGYDGTNWSSWIEFASSATVSGINTRLTTAETDIDNLESSRLKTYASDSSAWDTSPTSASTKPVTSGGIYDAITDIYEVMGKNGAKNFINNTSVSAIDGKVQYTVNSDESISINILSALSDNAGRIVGYINVKAGLTYKLTGGVSNKVRIDFRNSDYSMWTDNAQSKEVTSPKQSYSVDTFTPNNDATLMVYIRIDSSTATGNAGTVYPMLRLATDSDSAYQPYAMTNKQITPYVQAISNPNLLDNPWFTVNQRGVTNTWTTDYGVDRWTLARASVAVQSNKSLNFTWDGTGVSGIIGQFFEDWSVFNGKTVTASAIIDDRLYSVTFPNVSETNNQKSFELGIMQLNFPSTWGRIARPFQILINDTTMHNIKAVKLELGSVSTLAMDTAPNYATELLKCQRYFYAFNGKPNLTGHSYAIIGTGYAASANNIRLPFYLPVEMRIVPTVSVSALSDVVIMSELADAATPSAIALDSASCDRNNIGLFNITSDGNFVKGHSASVYTKNGCRINLSADL